jgi:hypothetical protein
MVLLTYGEHPILNAPATVRGVLGVALFLSYSAALLLGSIFAVDFYLQRRNK